MYISYIIYYIIYYILYIIYYIIVKYYIYICILLYHILHIIYYMLYHSILYYILHIILQKRALQTVKIMSPVRTPLRTFAPLRRFRDDQRTASKWFGLAELNAPRNRCTPMTRPGASNMSPLVTNGASDYAWGTLATGPSRGPRSRHPPGGSLESKPKRVHPQKQKHKPIWLGNHLAPGSHGA